MPSALPLAVVIVAGIVYHVAQKGSGDASPWPMLIVAYATALAMALGLALTSDDPRRWHFGRIECVAGVMIGLAAFGIEAGFFFVYRAGWKLGSASVIANVTCTAVLALIGITVFREHLGATRAAGLALAAGGAALLVRG